MIENYLAEHDFDMLVHKVTFVGRCIPYTRAHNSESLFNLDINNKLTT